jgi:hypothetical protein
MSMQDDETIENGAQPVAEPPRAPEETRRVFIDRLRIVAVGAPIVATLTLGWTHDAKAY